jgi:hypothetical protein
MRALMGVLRFWEGVEVEVVWVGDEGEWMARHG